MSTPPTPLGITYIDPDGNPWNLSDLTMSRGYVCSAISGIEGFPVMFQVIPFLDGTAAANIYIPQPGTIGIAILVSRPASDSENDYYSTLDNLIRAFLTRRNELPKAGTLIITRPNGGQRQISTYTTSGFDTPTVGANNMALYTFALATPDPYWTDVNASSLTYQISTANAGILPLLPVAFNGPAVIGDTVINNLGTSMTFPTWLITGPGTPTITNKSASPQRTWSLKSSVPAGQQVQVTTKRGFQSVVNKTTGANMWSQLVIGSPRDLWPLLGGPNNVTITMANATPASSIICSWSNRWGRA
jgi:hypothetical protein